MSVEYRKERGCWTWRVHRYGKRHKGYGFATKEEAKAAEKQFLSTLSARPRHPATALGTVAEQVVAYAQEHKSHSRAQGLCLNLERFILPHFGAQTLISEITKEEVESFVRIHLQRVKPMTVWHYVKDLRATLNYAIRQGLLDKNPVNSADLSKLSKRRTPKPPLSMAMVDKQSSVLTGRDRLYFDTLRLMGLRKDEGNSILFEDILERDGLWLHVRGTKTHSSDRYLPIPPALWEGFSITLRTSKPGEFLFGKRGKKVYDRRKLFDRAAKLSGTSVLKPKDLRDYFASIMRDPLVASKMLGHTNLQTTAIYTRQVQERMVEGVRELGQASADIGRSTGNRIEGTEGAIDAPEQSDRKSGGQ